MKWKIEYSVIISWVVLLLVIVWLSVALYRHECPQPTLPEIEKKHLIKIKEIQNAESKEDIDSLLIELYEFGSK